jgi:hypothetical protein
MNAKNNRSFKRTIILAFLFVFFTQVAFGANYTYQPVSAATKETATPTLPPPLPTQTPTITPKPTSTARPPTGPLPTQFPTLSDFNTYVDSVKLHLSQLGYGEQLLTFPDSKIIYIRLPDQWQSKASSSFTIHYTLFYETANQPTQAANKTSRFPNVKVYINNILASTFTPTVGKDQSFTFEMPITVIDRIANPNNVFSFTFEYVDQHDDFCGYVGVLKIHDDSSFNVNFDFMAPNLEVSRFPSPVSQNSSLPETIYFIIPDNYNGSDLSAAATTAAMINRLNESQAAYKLVKESDRMGIPDKANVVIIGSPTRNAFLRDFLYKPSGNSVGMPSTLASGNKIYINSASRFLADDEGLIQVMQSLRNPRFSYMVVTGNTDAAVERAAMGLSSPPVIENGAGFIVSPSFKVPEYQLNDVITLKTLGFNSTTYYGYGTNIYAVNFYVPRNWKMEDGTSFILRYRNSDNLDEFNSSLAVYMNDQPAGSVKIDVKNTGEKEVVIPINKKDIRSGWLNTIRIEASSDMIRYCAYNPRAFLINIQDTSMLTLPHSLITNPKELSPITQPIYYFGSRPSIYVSMPAKPTVEDLKILMSFSSIMGALRLPAINYKVTLGTQTDISTISGENILVIGRPSTNPNITKINKYLPQGFLSNTDTLEQKVGNATYQVPPGVSLGLIEAITSPFNPEMGLTLISGTTQEGQNFVYNRLTRSPSNIFELEGNLVFIGDKTTKAFEIMEGGQIALDMASSSVTGTKVALVVVPTGEVTKEVITTPIVKYVSNVSVENPVSQMLGKYLLIGLLVAGAVILIIAITRVARGGRRA